MFVKKKLIIFVDWFLPGFKAGGQIQSCANLADALQDSFDVYVITTDRDLGDQSAYHDIRPDTWNTLHNGVKVFYISPLNLQFSFMHDIVRQLRPDCIYLNSIFSWHFTILPLLMHYRTHTKIAIVLAPRGMLHAGALQYSRLKKKIFLAAFKMIRLQKNILFQATDETELLDIQKVFGARAKIKWIQDFNASSQLPFQTVKKDRGELKCLFVSRIAQKKNLLYLLTLLQQVTATASLIIAGPVEEETYWKECMQTIQLLPANITVHHAGAVPHLQLGKIYLDHHLFILPTFGENFGHVIFESLLYGRPVLISDKTPWQDLEQKKAGWSVGLDKKESFLSVINTACAWNQEAFDAHAKAAWQYASAYIQQAGLTEKYIGLFGGELSDSGQAYNAGESTPPGLP